ncbi:hypothetical protein [Salibaculum griseiflavum]|uniref:Phosphoadenosine phosphosulfate reductase n=1 Tax=Salibaculum griseiflavum TaxID=1914409 RepID=A0A2V1P4A0_9RHOB|nr:hypothetical protein [Salibaculum griseiflavum]PWG16588.1 hypothetical protein DFK10_10590 [Salibaculum griseiflavum]
MADQELLYDLQLEGLDANAWLARVEEICGEIGYCELLGNHHLAMQIDAGPRLFVSFENIPSARKFNPEAAPRGWLLARDRGWSCLTILSKDPENWFRDPAIYAFFDRLIDDGYFDEFEDVLFYGAGGAGYAAAAYSVSAPEARVLALRPQATLDPARAPWDRRFMAQRRKDFTSRFGYAPMMLETASQAWIVHDPMVPEDAMHATLFEAPNTTLLRTPHLGLTPERDLSLMRVLDDMIDEAMDGTLDAASFAGYWRARQGHLPYLRTLFHMLEEDGRDRLLAKLCRFVLRDTNRPLFAKKLAQIEARGADATTMSQSEDA